MSDENLTDATPEGRKEYAARAAANKKILAKVVKSYEESQRRAKQRSAQVIAMAAAISPQRLLAESETIVDMAESFEPRVRTEGLKGLAALVAAGYDPDPSVKEVIEDSLYDEDNGMVRGAAYSWYCAYGATDPVRSDQVWPFIAESTQCCHGNEEFDDMLVDLLGFAKGEISDETAAALANLLDFDANNGIGTLKVRCQEIIKVCNDR